MREFPSVITFKLDYDLDCTSNHWILMLTFLLYQIKPDIVRNQLKFSFDLHRKMLTPLTDILLEYEFARLKYHRLTLRQNDGEFKVVNYFDTSNFKFFLNTT